MVYLVDEKKERQNNYGWNESRFKKYSDYLKPIYNKKQLDQIKKTIFASKDNIILFHDSFFDDPKNRHKKKSDKIHQDLLDNELITITFSGSKASRHIYNKKASLPVRWVYENLEFFLERIEDNDINLNYLAFGKNYSFERIAEIRQDIWSSLYKFTDNEYIEFRDEQEQKLNKLLCLLNSKDCYDTLVQSKITVGYFKFMINRLIKERLS